MRVEFACTELPPSATHVVVYADTGLWLRFDAARGAARAEAEVPAGAACVGVCLHATERGGTPLIGAVCWPVWRVQAGAAQPFRSTLDNTLDPQRAHGRVLVQACAGVPGGPVGLPAPRPRPGLCDAWAALHDHNHRTRIRRFELSGSDLAELRATMSVPLAARRALLELSERSWDDIGSHGTTPAVLLHHPNAIMPVGYYTVPMPAGSQTRAFYDAVFGAALAEYASLISRAEFCRAAVAREWVPAMPAAVAVVGTALALIGRAFPYTPDMADDGAVRDQMNFIENTLVDDCEEHNRCPVVAWRQLTALRPDATSPAACAGILLRRFVPTIAACTLSGGGGPHCGSLFFPRAGMVSRARSAGIPAAAQFAELSGGTLESDPQFQKLVFCAESTDAVFPLLFPPPAVEAWRRAHAAASCAAFRHNLAPRPADTYESVTELITDYFAADGCAAVYSFRPVPVDPSLGRILDARLAPAYAVCRTTDDHFRWMLRTLPPPRLFAEDAAPAPPSGVVAPENTHVFAVGRAELALLSRRSGVSARPWSAGPHVRGAVLCPGK